jgi:hypothetical protein
MYCVLSGAWLPKRLLHMIVSCRFVVVLIVILALSFVAGVLGVDNDNNSSNDTSSDTSTKLRFM